MSAMPLAWNLGGTAEVSSSSFVLNWEEGFFIWKAESKISVTEL